MLLTACKNEIIRFGTHSGDHIHNKFRWLTHEVISRGVTFTTSSDILSTPPSLKGKFWFMRAVTTKIQTHHQLGLPKHCIHGKHWVQDFSIWTSFQKNCTPPMTTALNEIINTNVLHGDMNACSCYLFLNDTTLDAVVGKYQWQNVSDHSGVGECHWNRFFFFFFF